MRDYNKIVAWIPHSSTFIPNKVDTEVANDNLILSDLFIDKLYPYLTNRIVSKYSRFVVDLERYSDDSKESMSKVGMGMLYCKTIKGNSFTRSFGEDSIYRQYYIDMHNELKRRVEEIGDGCILLDIHSFNNTPLACDTDSNPSRPDLCIGFNGSIEEALKKQIEEISKEYNKTVKFNSPFIGAMTANTKVKHHSIMLELNKRTYMIGQDLRSDAYKTSIWLKRIVDCIVDFYK